jgi:hypothetical protein
LGGGNLKKEGRAILQAEAIETELFEGTQMKAYRPMGFPYEMVRAKKVSGFGDSANVEYWGCSASSGPCPSDYGQLI